jgi:hypothetical protein
LRTFAAPLAAFAVKMPEPWFFTSKSTMPAQRTGLQIACIHAWEAFEEYRQLQNLGKTKPGFLDVF